MARPNDAFPTADEPIIIGIAGEDSFGEAFDVLVRDKTVRGRAVKVKRFEGIPALNCCHILFIAQSEQQRLPIILDKLRDCPVLTVGDMPEFLERGGGINFVTRGNRVRFEVNLHASSKANLQISSKLLNLATRVVGDNNGVGQ